MRTGLHVNTRQRTRPGRVPHETPSVTVYSTANKTDCGRHHRVNQVSPDFVNGSLPDSSPPRKNAVGQQRKSPQGRHQHGAVTYER